MQVGLCRTTINSCVCFLSSLLFNLYVIVFILLIIYLHIIVSSFTQFIFAKRDHHLIHPLSKVITIGWISLIFLTQYIDKISSLKTDFSIHEWDYNYNGNLDSYYFNCNPILNSTLINARLPWARPLSRLVIVYMIETHQIVNYFL